LGVKGVGSEVKGEKPGLQEKREFNVLSRLPTLPSSPYGLIRTCDCAGTSAAIGLLFVDDWSAIGPLFVGDCSTIRH